MVQQVRIFDGIPYKYYEAFPTKQTAERVAETLRTPAGNVFPPPARTLARVHDCGMMEGRRRYAVYIRPGE